MRRREALDHVAGWTLVVDLFVPHDDVYRPNVRLRALDGSCLVGPAVAPRDALRDPDALTIDVQVGDAAPRQITTAGMRRNVATLIQDVSEFMTLHPGDVLMLGARHAMPRVAAGQRLRVHADGLGTLEAEWEPPTHEDRPRRLRRRHPPRRCRMPMACNCPTAACCTKTPSCGCRRSNPARSSRWA